MDDYYLHILLIDDDEDDYIITRDLLAEIAYPIEDKKRQFELDWVDSYEAGLAAIEQNQHHVFLVDYRLGQQNGLELIRDSIERGCSAPLILLTGQGDRAVDLEAMQAGAADYLVKGQMDAPLLERSIRYALERKRAEFQIQRHNRELALLNQVILASAAGLAPEAILEIACRELAITFEVPRGTAILLNDEKTIGVVVAQYVERGVSPRVGQNIPVDNSFLKSLLSQKTPLFMENAQNDPRLEPFHQLLQERGVVALLLLPIFVDHNPVGAIILSVLKPHTFSSQEINLAWSVANQIAGAMARARLIRTQQRLSTAIAQSAENVIITDTNAAILYVNPAFERTTGYNLAEVTGRRMNILKSGRHDEFFYRDLWQTITSGQVWRGRFINKRKDDSLYSEESTISPVLNEDGQIVNFVRVSRDVSRELQLEEQLRQAQKMDAIGQLAGGVAHDFNNMLTAIMGYTGLAMEMLPPSHQVYSDIQGIQKIAERAAALTRQLLAFARQQISQPRMVNLNDLITNMDKLLGRLIGADIELVTLPAPTLGTVKIDPTQFEQVLVNLVLNARDAMPKGGKLTIETANITINHVNIFLYPGINPGKYVVLAVSDTGIGMSEEVMTHIFEPFFTTKNVGEGTGLGLATCFGIVKQSGGHIHVDSEPGQGTTFKIFIPWVEAAPAPALVRDRFSRLPTGTETILLVEDEVAVRELTARVLRQQGYTVFEATSGDEALHMIQRRPVPTIHLLLTDLVMPRMGGKALVDQLLPLYPALKVLLISGYGYGDHMVIHNDMLKLKAAFLQKPFTPEQLAHKVRYVLNQDSR